MVNYVKKVKKVSTGFMGYVKSVKNTLVTLNKVSLVLAASTAVVGMLFGLPALAVIAAGVVLFNIFAMVVNAVLTKSKGEEGPEYAKLKEEGKQYFKELEDSIFKESDKNPLEKTEEEEKNLNNPSLQNEEKANHNSKVTINIDEMQNLKNQNNHNHKLSQGANTAGNKSIPNKQASFKTTKEHNIRL